MNLKLHLDQRRGLIDKALKGFLPGADKEPKALHRAMRYSVFSGGKRIRPIIVVEAAAACGGLRQAQGAVPAACAVELVHTYSLVHDDLPAMDDDDYRRGKPACHKAFGDAAAILAGDGLLTLAFNIIARHAHPAAAASLAAELSEAIGTRGMVGGQAADIEFKHKKKDVQTIERINLLKTAKLFEVSAKLGAIAARSGAREAKAMARYGLRLGKAFQIVDDIVDNDGCARLFGAAKARAGAKRLIEEAKESIKGFGRNAARLNGIADYVLHPIK